MNQIKIRGIIKRSIETGLYTAYVDGVIIGDFGFKFQAKRAIKKYINNNFNTQEVVYKEDFWLKKGEEVSLICQVQ